MFQQMYVLCSPFFLFHTKETQRGELHLSCSGIALHLDKCNTAGRMHRWINFRRYNAAQGQTPGEMKRRTGSFMRATKKAIGDRRGNRGN